MASKYKPHPTKIWFETVWVTPQDALELLGHADPNRTVHERRVNAIGRDMLGGTFEVNAETIKLAPDGALIDGEHRLWALVRAGDVKVHGDKAVKSVPFTIAHNVPREVRKTIDTGKTRSYVDLLRVRGYPGTNARLTASVLRLVTLYRAGGLDGAANLKGQVMLTNTEIDAVHADAKVLATIEYFIDTWGKARHGTTFKAVPVGFVYWRAAQDDPGKAEEWAEGVVTGVDMKADDPRFQLRERYHEPRTRDMRAVEALALAIKSWNLFALGEKVKVLTWRGRGQSAEAFPQFLADQTPSPKSGRRKTESAVHETKRHAAAMTPEEIHIKAEKVLAYIKAHPNVTQGKLAKATNIYLERLRPVLAHLEAMGQVEKVKRGSGYYFKAVKQRKAS